MRVRLAVLLSLCSLAAQAADGGKVARCLLSDTVDAGSGSYLVRCVERAEREGFRALLVQMDTPGGALQSTREIVQAFLRAEVPILVWVGPRGARAGSAGVFITLAAHVAAMAHATNIGAAHPVEGPSGADPEERGKAMGEKILNDTAAFVEAIAKERGRNAEWAVKAVRESASVEASEALKLDVIDLIIDSPEALLAEVDGRVVRLGEREVKLQTKGAELVTLEPSPRERVLHWLANPAIAYILFLLGGLGLAVEFSHPGLIVPGVIGVVSILLALLAFSALPVTAGGVALLALGLALIAAELFVTSGLLGVAGIGLMLLGGLFLVDPVTPSWFSEPSVTVSWTVVVPTTLTFGAALGFVIWKVAEARAQPQRVGGAGMVGERGTVLEAFSDAGEGVVFVRGERWRAVGPARLETGTRVVVRRIEDLKLTIEPE